MANISERLGTDGKHRMTARLRALLRKPPEFVLLLLYIATVPVMSFFHLRLGGQALLLCDFIFVLVVLASLPELFRRALRPGIFEAFLVFYLAATLVSTLVSGADYLGVVKVTYLVCVAGLTRRIAQRSPEAAVTAWLVGTGMAVIGCFLGVATFYLGWSSHLENPLLSYYGTLPPGPYPRVNSLFFNANMLCNYLIVGAALAWYRGYRKSLTGIVAASLFTFSPGLGGMALVLGLCARRVRGALGAGVVLALLSLGLVVVSRPALLEGDLEPSGRVLTWEGALQDWAAHPITGAGPGATTIDVRHRALGGWTFHNTDAHNVWLSVASQMGILGLAALLGLILYSLRRAPSRPPGLRDALRVALVGTWVIQGLSGSFEDSRHLWVLLGMLAATEDHGQG